MIIQKHLHHSIANVGVMWSDGPTGQSAAAGVSAAFYE